MWSHRQVTPRSEVWLRPVPAKSDYLGGAPGPYNFPYKREHRPHTTTYDSGLPVRDSRNPLPTRELMLPWLVRQ